MSLYGKADANTSAPKNAVDDKNNTGTSQYGNTIFGVNATEVTVAGGTIAHSGWVRRVRQRGPLLSIEISNAGTGYANNEPVSITAATGANAEGVVVTDGNGVITDITISNYGGTFYGTESVSIDTSEGEGAVLIPTYGGRANRVLHEVMVAQSSMTGDGDDDAIFPDS